MKCGDQDIGGEVPDAMTGFSAVASKADNGEKIRIFFENN